MCLQKIIINYDRGIILKKRSRPDLKASGLHEKELLVRILVLQGGNGLGLGLVGKRG